MRTASVKSLPPICTSRHLVCHDSTSCIGPKCDTHIAVSSLVARRIGWNAWPSALEWTDQRSPLLTPIPCASLFACGNLWRWQYHREPLRRSAQNPYHCCLPPPSHLTRAGPNGEHRPLDPTREPQQRRRRRLPSTIHWRVVAPLQRRMCVQFLLLGLCRKEV